MRRMFLRPDLDPPVTRESILAAKMAQLTDRERVRRETGAAITDDGDLLPKYRPVADAATASTGGVTR
jgi:hypothetical protein